MFRVIYMLKEELNIATNIQMKGDISWSCASKDTKGKC